MKIDTTQGLREIEEYLKEDKINSELVYKAKSFINSYESIQEEISKVESKIFTLNHRLKDYDLIDFLSSKTIPGDLKSINKIMQDLKLVELNDNEYKDKYKKVYLNVSKIGTKIVKDKINSKIESLYSNDDLITFIVLLDNKDEIMDKVIDKRKKICNYKISNLTGDEDVFYYLLVNQEIFMWSLLFSGDMNAILRRALSLEIPLGFTKFERFVYAIFKVYFEDRTEENLKKMKDETYTKVKDIGVINPFTNTYKEIDNYPEHKSIHEWVYNALLHKSLKEYLNNGVVEL